MLLGNGDGTFRSQTMYTSGTAPSSIVKGDFNKDKKWDLVVVNGEGQNVAIFLNLCS